MTDYRAFLEGKFRFESSSGFEIDPARVNPTLKEHIRAIVPWAIKGGRRAFFLNFGLGKTTLQIETMRIIGQESGEPTLIVLPLGVRQEFRRDAERFFAGEHAVELKFIRTSDEIETRRGPHPIYLTNYETVRDGKLDPARFVAASLDEAAVLRSYGSKTFQEFLPLFERVKYRFVATATPSPNRLKELIHYAGFLGIMDTGQALTRWFQRNSEKANDLTLYAHKETEFWLWVSSWAIMLNRPSDICRCPCHGEKNCSHGASESLLSKHGNPANFATAHGNAGAIAVKPSSPDQPTCSQAESSAAVASDPSMAGKVRGSTASGRVCSTAADSGATRTGRTMAAEGSSSAIDGRNSRTSAPTSATLRKKPHSTGSTTTGITSPGTADGQHGRSKPTTDVHIDRTESPGWCNSCRCDEGYDLPPLEVNWHEVPSNHAGAGFDRDGQALLLRDTAASLQAAAAEKRDSMAVRVAKMAALRAEEPSRHVVLWHHLEDERHAITAAIPTAVEVYGTMPLDERERRVIDFSEGRIAEIASKPILNGAGANWQPYCSWEIFVGIDYKFHDLIQAVHRVYRFGQTETVRIDIIHTEAERDIVDDIKAKWAEHDAMRATMAEIIKVYGLDHGLALERLRRTIGVNRREVVGDRFRITRNDCVAETATMPDNSVAGVVTSIPFANQYEYTPTYEDFGHTESNDQFWRQMDHLTPQLHRVLWPGRLACIHVKDRILFGNVTGQGVPTVSPFHAEAIFHYIRHGFQFMGMITIVTDVVRENNQTYRLGYTEMLKDGSKMGVGSPEYILLMRKPQSDRSRGYADMPIAKDPSTYSLARWQLDAHAFWRSSGNRLLTTEELIAIGPQKLAAYFPKWTLHAGPYDFYKHVGVAEAIEEKRPGALPRTFMALAPGSHDPMVWHDVNRMLTLNSEQYARNVEKHVCPLQLDVIRRLIERYSNPGEVIFDPFLGIGSVAYQAVRMGRRGAGSELSDQYFDDAVRYCRAAEAEATTPSLFDLPDGEEAA